MRLIVAVLFFKSMCTTRIYTFLHPFSLYDALPFYESVRCDVVVFGHRGCKVPGSGARGNKHVIFRVHGCARRSLASGTNRPFSDLDGPIWRRWSFSIGPRSEEHTSELQSLMRNSSAVLCLKNKTIIEDTNTR